MLLLRRQRPSRLRKQLQQYYPFLLLASNSQQIKPRPFPNCTAMPAVKSLLTCFLANPEILSNYLTRYPHLTRCGRFGSPSTIRIARDRHVGRRRLARKRSGPSSRGRLMIGMPTRVRRIGSVGMLGSCASQQACGSSSRDDIVKGSRDRWRETRASKFFDLFTAAHTGSSASRGLRTLLRTGLAFLLSWGLFS